MTFFLTPASSLGVAVKAQANSLAPRVCLHLDVAPTKVDGRRRSGRTSRQRLAFPHHLRATVLAASPE